MKLMIDTTAQTLVQDTGTEQHTIPLHSKAAFELLSQLWVQVGWSQKYSYTFSWMMPPPSSRAGTPSSCLSSRPGRSTKAN